MTQKQVDETRKEPRPRNWNSDFFIPMVSTGIPFVLLVVIMALMAGRGGELVWAASLILWILALLVSAGFAIASKRRISLGILAGTAIGLIGLMVSCSAILAAPGERSHPGQTPFIDHETAAPALGRRESGEAESGRRDTAIPAQGDEWLYAHVKTGTGTMTIDCTWGRPRSAEARDKLKD